MNRRAGFFACAAALAMCSCTSQVEVERARAAEEVARAEAEKAGADEKARVTAELMKRWNAAASGVTVQAPGFGQVNFRWNEADKFPHPTFKGGSAEAYGAFAGVLQSFFENDDNFEFLAKNNLFTTELRYALPSGQVPKWTFASLAEQLSKPDAHGDHSPAVRKKLEDFAEKMKTPPKA